MTDIEKKALALVNEARAKLGFPPFDRCDRSFYAVEAVCRAIEQHEAYKREVSDAVESLVDMPRCDPDEVDLVAGRLGRFIIPKPDPLVEVLNDLYPETSGNREYANQLRAAIEARGGRIVWEGE